MIHSFSSTKKSSLSYSSSSLSSSSPLSFRSSSSLLHSPSSSTQDLLSDNKSCINHTIVASRRIPMNDPNMSNIIAETENNNFQKKIYDQITCDMYNRLVEHRHNNNIQAPLAHDRSDTQIPDFIYLIPEDKKKVRTKIQTKDMPFSMDL